MNLYDQLIKLQMIPDAYTKWESYREALTDYIIGQIGNQEKVAILGIGRSNDINLNRLISHVETLTLWDKDKAALESAIRQYGLDEDGRIELKVQDLLGVTEEDYRLYADCLVKAVRQKGMQTEISDLVKIAIQEIEKFAMKMQPINLGIKAYDTIIVVGLHSQLLSMIEWIWQVILQTLGKDESNVRRRIIDLNGQIISAFHQQLIESAKVRIITGCELKRKDRIGSIQGAIQGIQDLEYLRKQNKLKKENECLLEWTFNKANDMVYEMLIQCDYII